MDSKTIDVIRLILQILGVVISLGILTWAKQKYAHWKNTKDTNRALILEIEAKRNETLMQEIRAIKKEVQPNGGSSLNDKVSGIVDKLTAIDRGLANLKSGQRNNREIQYLANWESDENGRITYVSNAFCELLKCTEHDALGNGWLALLEEGDRKRVYSEWMDSVHNGYQYNAILNFKKITVKAVAIHSRDENDRVVGSLCRLIKSDEQLN